MTRYSTSIDIWAAGCILAELYLLTPIFKGKTEGDQLFAIATRLGKMTRTEKSFFKERVPYEPIVLNMFDDLEKEDFNQTFKMSKDRSNLIDLLEKMSDVCSSDLKCSNIILPKESQLKMLSFIHTLMKSEESLTKQPEKKKKLNERKEIVQNKIWVNDL